jgi:hypothetical protein
MKKQLFLVGAGFLAIGLTFGMSYLQKASATVPGTNYLVSSDASGAWANNGSNITQHAISGDGKYVVFSSNANNLVSGSGTTGHVYVKNTQTNTVTIADVSDTGTIGNGGSNAVISYDGRYVAFVGNSLTTGVTGNNIYRRDLVNSTTTIVSVDASGTPFPQAVSPDISADGRYLAFSYTNSSQLRYVVWKDMLTGSTQTLSTTGSPRGGSYSPSIDCDGHVVVFSSSDILTSDTPYYANYVNYTYNYYLVNVDGVTNPKTYIASQSDNQKTPAQISCNGNVVVYDYADQVFSYNRLTKVATSLNPYDNSINTNPGLYRAVSVSDDGRYVAFVSRGSNLDSSHSTTYRGTAYDAFVRDTKTSSTLLLSFTTLGNMSGLVPTPTTGMVSISPDGSTVAYTYTTPDSTNPNGELISGVHTGQRDIYTSKTSY